MSRITLQSRVAASTFVKARRAWRIDLLFTAAAGVLLECNAHFSKRRRQVTLIQIDSVCLRSRHDTKSRHKKAQKAQEKAESYL